MKKPTEDLDFYINPKLQLHLQAQQRIKVLIAGRRFSKSFGNGISVSQKIENMPRATGTLIGPSYTNFISNTLLSIIQAWERLGYYQDVHYVIGKKPPKWFEHPYQRPQRYENVISWWCGHACVMGSMDRPQLLRGSSRDYVVADEALLMHQDMFDQVIMPTTSGSDIRLQGRPHHRNIELTSSMPYGTVAGKWILDFEEKAKKDPERYYYSEGTTYDNMVVLGKDYIRDMKASMSKIGFDIECLNKRIKNLGSVFYPALKDRHFYQPRYNYNYIDDLGYNLNPKKGPTITSPDSRWDADCDPNMPLNISHDWGTFNNITVDQYHESLNEVRFINHLWVVHPDIIDDLANNFCDYYQHHQKKVVYQWGDKSGNKREANAKETNFQQFASILRKRGWRVIKQKTGDIIHLDRHNFIIKLHSESNSTLPTITHNAEKCKDLRIALDSAPMKGIKKDKSSELPSSNIKPQHATHSTDAYDYRLYHGFKGMEKHGRSGAYRSEVRFGGS
jgi:hypothetical protein